MTAQYCRIHGTRCPGTGSHCRTDDVPSSTPARFPLILPASLHFHFDCDGVLLDWEKGFRLWLERFHNLQPDSRGPDSWDMASWTGRTDTFTLIKDFNDSTFFAELEPMAGAVEAIQALRRQGHHLSVLSSCGRGEPFLTRRARNLERHFGKVFYKTCVLGLGEAKAWYLGHLQRGVWVEDNYRNAVMGLEAGHETWMLRRRHNEAGEDWSNPQIKWVDNLQAIVSHYTCNTRKEKDTANV